MNHSGGGNLADYRPLADEKASLIARKYFVMSFPFYMYKFLNLTRTGNSFLLIYIDITIRLTQPNARRKISN